MLIGGLENLVATQHARCVSVIRVVRFTRVVIRVYYLGYWVRGSLGRTEHGYVSLNLWCSLLAF